MAAAIIAITEIPAAASAAAFAGARIVCGHAVMGEWHVSGAGCAGGTDECTIVCWYAGMGGRRRAERTGGAATDGRAGNAACCGANATDAW